MWKRQKEERISYELNGVRFDIDKWDKKTCPYPYMEIEVNSESELQDIVEKLGIPRGKTFPQSLL